MSPDPPRNADRATTGLESAAFTAVGEGLTKITTTEPSPESHLPAPDDTHDTPFSEVRTHGRGNHSAAPTRPVAGRKGTFSAYSFQQVLWNEYGHFYFPGILEPRINNLQAKLYIRGADIAAPPLTPWKQSLLARVPFLGTPFQGTRVLLARPRRRVRGWMARTLVRRVKHA